MVKLSVAPIADETPEERAAFEAERRQKLGEQMSRQAAAKNQRKLEIPLVKEATVKMEWLFTTGSHAAQGAGAVLRYCYGGEDSHTLKYDDVRHMDPDNTELALLLINTVARQKYSLPKEYLSGIGLEILQS